MKIAFIGEKHIIYGFKGLGIDIFPVTDEKEATEIFFNLIKGNKYSIIYITETFAQGLMDEISRVSRQTSLSVIIIPGVGKKTGLGMEKLRRIAARAAGADILGE